MNNFNFWQKWLFFVCLIMITLGIILALFYGTPLFAGLQSLINLSFWVDPAAITPAILANQSFLVGLMGALMASWGMSAAFIARYPFSRQENWSRTCLVLSVGLWFVMDESISLYYHVYANAIGNLGFLVLLALPLVFTWNSFQVNTTKSN
jgi:hypothetical protein